MWGMSVSADTILEAGAYSFAIVLSVIAYSSACSYVYMYIFKYYLLTTVY